MALHNGAMSDVTHILSQFDAGDPAAAELLLPLVYDELRKLAAARLAHEKPGQTLQATALVHEAYVRLVGNQSSEIGSQKSEDGHSAAGLRPLASGRWHSRGHFFAAAAEAMRRILVERARQKLGPMRGGHLLRVDLEALGDVADSKAELIV